MNISILKLPKVTNNNNFDFLRFLLAFIVVVKHTIILSNEKELTFLSPFFRSGMAVNSFFILSGFLITKSYLQSDTITSYFKKRSKRLLPGYLVVVFLCTISLFLVSNLNYSDYFTSIQTLKYLLANVFFLNFIQPSLPGVFESQFSEAVNGSLWTIKIEIGFYCILPFIINWFSKLKTKNGLLLVLIGFYVFAYIYRYGCNQLYLLTQIKFVNELADQLPGFGNYFVVGIGLYLFHEKIFLNKNKFIIPAVIIFLVEYLYTETEIVLPIALGLILYYLAFSFGSLNNWGRFGDLSYGMYIFHFPVIQTLVSISFYNQIPLFKLILTLIIILLIAFLSWNFIEKPFLENKKRR